MTEYICEASERVPKPGEGYTFICKAGKCPGDHKRKVYIDAEPINLCLANGIILEEKGLAQKIQHIPIISPTLH